MAVPVVTRQHKSFMPLLLTLLLGCSAGASQVPTPREAHPAASLVDGLHGAPDGGRETGGWTTRAGQTRALDAAALSPVQGRLASGDERPTPCGSEAARLDHTPKAVCPSREVPAVIAVAAAGAPTRGVWAYAKPSHGPGYLAIPEGPGWIVEVCGPLDCFDAVSTDAGPELWLQKPPHSRIGDLSAVMFQRACGSLSAGLCRGSYEILGAADQHPQDPPADPRDDAMRDEVGDELYTLPPTDQETP